MRSFTSIVAALFVALCLACGSSSAQTVSTVPVGFNTTTVAANSITSLGVPFDRVAKFAAAVSSRTATTVTTANAGWTASSPANANSFGPFSGTGENPHFLLMKSGASAGRRFLIDSNTTDTLTITTGGDLTTQIANGDTYQIIPCHTLGELFGTDGGALNSTNSATTADNVQLRENGAWLTYFHTANPNGFWARIGGGSTNFNNHAILPEQGLLLVRRAGSYSFTGLGVVPSTNLVTDFPANSVTHFANRFPTDTTLAGLGLHSLVGWVSANSSGSADQVLIYSSGAWQTYFHTTGVSGFWAKVGGGSSNFDTTAIPMGTSVLVVRRPGTNVTLTQTLPYNLNN
jgi:uncharacterized protein (TIGR02597 family)